jgi:uncharacterized protein (DUF302 family)
MQYAYKKQLDVFFEEAIKKTKVGLIEGGFGILTEIDVKDTLKKKLDVDYDNYIILGACNPPNAYKALQVEKEIGLLLPCNVLVYEDGGKVFVSAILPKTSMGFIDNPKLLPIAEAVESKLKKIIDNL